MCEVLSFEKFSKSDNSQDSFLNDRYILLQEVLPEESQDSKSLNRISPPFLILPDLVLLVNENDIQTSVKSENEIILKKVYRCEICNRSFKQRRYLSRHRCLKDSKKDCECKICHKSFFDVSTLMRHIKLHTGIKPFECEQCHKTFSRSDNFKTHCRRHNPETSILSNNATEKNTRNARVRCKRRLALSDCQDPFECEVCNKKFVRKSSLYIHMRLHLPYQCNICKSTFSMKQQVTEHLRTHENVEFSKRTFVRKLILENSDESKFLDNTAKSKENHAYQCKICKKPFCLRSNLIEHERVHTGQRPYECDVCYKRFSTQGILNVHRRIHTGERPYKCSSCPRAFIEKTKLNIHMRLHAGVKPFECSICYKSFAIKQNLNNHYRTHTGERPFECDICHKSFVEKSAHNKHKKTHYKQSSNQEEGF